MIRGYLIIDYYILNWSNKQLNLTYLNLLEFFCSYSIFLVIIDDEHWISSYVETKIVFYGGISFSHTDVYTIKYENIIFSISDCLSFCENFNIFFLFPSCTFIFSFRSYKIPNWWYRDWMNRKSNFDVAMAH